MEKDALCMNELHHSILEETARIQEQAYHVINVQDALLEGLAVLLEGRNGEQAQHVRSTKRFVSMMVSYMLEQGMYPEAVTENFAQFARSASALHDIGKIKIPEVLLQKTGRYLPEDFVVMKMHTTLGAELLHRLLDTRLLPEVLQIYCDVAQYHHERWDGTGYPEGLKGEEIPLAARIMMVADVFEAMTAHREYKQALALPEAYAELHAQSGKQFDPALVEVFFAIRPQVEQYLGSLKQ